MDTLTTNTWSDYQLIDTGDREKLERFGPWVLIRPEPQAVWKKALPEKEWEQMSHARYVRLKGKKNLADEAERGTWNRKPKMPDQWMVSYASESLKLRFRLGLTAFGHIGVFPEQAINWEYVVEKLNPKSKIRDLKSEIQNGKVQTAPRVLNLFAYTGGASLAARAAGADVVHVDSVRPVITWAKEMMMASDLDNIRWVVEDALQFVRREAKRGNRYDGIILDPPAYGRGPYGEKWVLEDSIDEMISHCSRLLEPHGFLVLSLYSMGLSALIAESLVKTHFGDIADLQSGEFYFPDRAGRKLPLGTYLRFSKTP